MAETRIDWRAVRIGAAVGIGAGLALGVLLRLFPFDAERLWLVHALSYGVGAAIDLACGATAGVLARRDGALHGALAGAIQGVVSPLLGLAMFFATTRFEAPFDGAAWLRAVAFGSLLGIALAAFAGWLAARWAASRAP